MTDMEKAQKAFVAYEYKEVMTDQNRASFLLDSYENFGWEADENIPVNSYSPHQKNILLRLKRNRRIVNKMELTRLQRNFEACVKEIEQLEKRKASRATMYALIIGMAGTAFMAGSVFAVTAQPPHVILCIILAIPAFAGWTLPVFVHRRILVKETETVTPLIEAKYDEIYEICEKGNRLLH